MDLFRHPSYLLWLAAAALGSAGLALWSESRRKTLTEAFAGAALAARLYPPEALRMRRVKYLLEAAALAMLLLALAGPQWGVELVSTRTRGTQAVIAVDTSLSMLTEDVKPSRMELAKNELSLLMDALKGQRLGLIAFAGEAQIQCPLTTDIDAVKSFLGRVNAGIISPPGTALGKALDLGSSMLRRYPGQKALVLLTDGEDHGSGPLEAARRAAEAGVHVYIIGVGTPEGAPIPIKDAQGNITGYKKDSKGQTVISRLVESGLIQLAAASSGAYYRASGTETEANDIAGQILGLDKSAVQTGSTTRYHDRYRLPLALAILLLLADLLIPELRESWRGGGVDGGASTYQRASGNALRVGARILPLLALFLSGCHPNSDMRLWRGNSRYKTGDYEEALEQYRRAADKNGRDPRPVFNSGTALYKMGEYDGAKKAFEAVSDPRKVPAGLASRSFYDMGNALYRKQQLKEAAQAYKNCLILDPKNENCRYNLVLALKSPPPDKKKQDKQDQNKQNRQNPPPPQNRPQSSSSSPRPQSGDNGMSREDAERLLQAVKEKEKAADKAMQAQTPRDSAGKPQPGEDW